MRTTDPRTTKFGIVLSGLRENAGMNVTELAKAVSRSISYLSQMEAGKKRPTDLMIRRISIALDINPMVLFTAAGMIPMPLAESLRPANATVRLDEELSELEREELLKYLNFLRYESTLQPTLLGPQSETSE